MQHALFIFKDSVMYHILKNRRDTKFSSLRQIMSEYIKKHQKRKEQNRVLKRERDALPLD